jgi:hypothetical protein
VAIVGLVVGGITLVVAAGAGAYALAPARGAAPQPRALGSIPLPSLSTADDVAPADPTDTTGPTPTSTQTPADAAPATFDDLQTGQCLSGAIGTGNVTEPVVVACTAPHKGQIYAVREAKGGDDYPGEPSIRKQADSLCRKADRNLVAKRPRRPHYIIWYPQEERWLDGDHRIVCLIGTGSTATRTTLVRPGVT